MRRVTADEARKILTGQGLRQPLLQEAEAFRRKYPWQGAREVTVPRYPYFGREILARALAALLSGANLLLVGPKAAGKNILAECLALLLGRPAWNVSFHIDVDASYLIGMDTFKEGEVRFRPGRCMSAPRREASASWTKSIWRETRRWQCCMPCLTTGGGWRCRGMKSCTCILPPASLPP